MSEWSNLQFYTLVDSDVEGRTSPAVSRPRRAIYPSCSSETGTHTDDHHTLIWIILKYKKKRYDGLQMHSSTHIHHFDPEVRRTNTTVVVVPKQTFLESLHLV